MAAVMFFSLGLFVFTTLPILTYFYAKHLNRNPKIWFFIGLVLPGIATIILTFLAEKSKSENLNQQSASQI